MTSQAPPVDLRQIDPTDWRAVLHEALDDASGNHVTVLADHSPEAILAGCRGERGEALTWEALEAGPTVWRYRVDVPPGRPRHALSSVLRADHARLQEILTSLEQAVEARDRSRAAILSGQFGSELRRHMRREEEVLFPAFEKHTGLLHGPTDIMKQEHETLRAALASLELTVEKGGDLAESLGALLATLQPHEAKEEQILYPMTDQALPAARRIELLQAMQAI